MDASKPAPPSNASRTLVIALVAVLIVVAIAGIVLAGLRGRSAGTGLASTSASGPTRQPVEGTTTVVAPPAVEAEAGAGPNLLAYAKASDTLTPASLKKIADIALAAKKEGHNVVVTARLEAGDDREQRMETAKKRVDGVRRALQAAGVSINVIKIQVSELPAGLVRAPDSERVELAMK